MQKYEKKTNCNKVLHQNKTAQSTLTDLVTVTAGA